MHQLGVTKRRRNISVAKLRLTLMIILAMQFPNIFSIISSQLSISFKTKELHQNFKDINFTNVAGVDLISRKLMQRLHDDLDYDDDGNVSLSEGAEFIDREDFDSVNSNLPGFATDKDGRITEAEFWGAWMNSTVHNWTVSQMIDWLSFDVDLPQYATKFKQYGISGAAMPILAGNSSVVLSLVDGVKEHRLKLWLKAMEVVLCGYSPSKGNFLKDVLLSISIGLAFGGIAYALYVRRTAAAAVAMMQEKLTNLQNEMIKLDDEDQWLRDSVAEESREDCLMMQYDSHSSESSLGSESSSLYSRLNEVMDELSDTRHLLEQAEVRLSDRKWSPPCRLLTCLKETYKVEKKLHESKRRLAHKTVEQTKSQFLKMKKKTSIFNSVQLIHSRQVDKFDVEIEVAKGFLREVQRDSHEHKIRWREIESICHCPILSNHVATVTVQNHASLPNFNRKPSDTSFFSNSSSIKDYDDESITGLIMKDFPSLEASSESYVAKSPVSRDHHRSETISRSSTFLSVASSLPKSPSPIPEEDDVSKSCGTFPKRCASNKKYPISSQTLKQFKSADKTSAGIGDVSLALSLRTSSTVSLPDLTSDSEDRNNTVSEKKKFYTRNSKLKKRSLFGSGIFRKIVKS